MNKCEVHALPLLALLSAVLLTDVVAAPAPLPRRSAPVPSGVIVLDNCDPEFKGKDSYGDNVSFFSRSGVLRGRTSGLNICEEIGSPHRVAVDVAHKRAWVSETVGGRLLCYDLAGKQLFASEKLHLGALAIDPASGNVWATAGSEPIGTGTISIYDGSAKRLVEYAVSAYDLAYDPVGKAVWAVEKHLVKLSLDGKVPVRKDIATWCAVSVSVDPRNGAVWAVARHHSGKLGENALLGFDNDGKALYTIPLGERAPFKVAVNRHDGSVWVAVIGKSVLHYSDKGKLLAEHKLHAITLDTDPHGDGVWVVTKEELLAIDPRGEVRSRTKHHKTTSQAWIQAY